MLPPSLPRWCSYPESSRNKPRRNLCRKWNNKHDAAVRKHCGFIFWEPVIDQQTKKLNLTRKSSCFFFAFLL